MHYRCKACRKDFSVTSGTLFAHRKLPLRTSLAAIAGFFNDVKRKSAPERVTLKFGSSPRHSESDAIAA